MLEAQGLKGGGRAFQVGGPRVRLRLLVEGNLAAFEGWFGRALGLSPAESAAKLARLWEESVSDASRWLLAVSEGPAPPAGIVACRVPWPSSGWLTFELAVLAEETRGRGLALEAVTVIEREARARGLADAFAAPVEAEFGRAVYFWLRLGYRPVLRSQLPWPDRGGADLWVVRDRP